MRLDTLRPVHATVGYGALGVGGDLGYEGKRVRVAQRAYDNALSTHPPARVTFEVGRRFRRFHCAVALNDDVAAGESHADFVVLADGREVAVVRRVEAGAPPRPVVADIGGARRLELVVSTTRWDHCHAVWLDPRLEASADGATRLVDCLDRAAIELPAALPRAQRCVATVASPAFVPLLDDMLGSLLANGCCDDALILVFALDDRVGAVSRIAAKYGAVAIPCTSRAPVTIAAKAVLYSVARVTDASRFLCLDSDTLVLDDLRPLFAAVDACREGTILACREGNAPGFRDLGQALLAIYGGTPSDIARLTGGDGGAAASYPLVVNDGVFAGSRAALLELDAAIRAMPEAPRWMSERPDVSWRNQFVFNLALAKLDCGVELDPTYNVQLHVQDTEMRAEGPRVRATWNGRPVRVLHFGGAGREKYPEWRGLFARASHPLPGGGSAGAYESFLHALRAWVGRTGLPALAWSFYGTSDGRTAHVGDPGAMPLFGLLHYMVRANGCVRVVETGTFRGVSTACLASAVAHRPGGRVVSFDLHVCPERADLWAALPAGVAQCIEARALGSIEGMTAAIAAGESYDAALLDSQHTAEHVWAEFELATRLVCPGGLIMIHDALYVHGTVEAALRRIQAAGYGVVRLWTAEGGVREDDNLGLAVIENRRYA